MVSATYSAARSRPRFEFDVVFVTVRVPVSHQFLTGCVQELAVALGRLIAGRPRTYQATQILAPTAGVVVDVEIVQQQDESDEYGQ